METKYIHRELSAVIEEAYWKFQCNCPLESNLNCPPLNFPQK